MCSAQVCLDSDDQNAELLVVFFDDDRTAMQPFYDEMDALSRFHPAAAINRITLHGNFSRGKALDTAARSSYIQPSDIIFFVDVDITFTGDSLDRIRLNTVPQRQVYLPIVFSEYDPRNRGSTPTATAADMPVGMQAQLDDEAGYFRQFGYGICAIYKADIMHASLNGFNTDITGWGLEDVRFLEQIIKLNQQPPQLLLLNLADNGTLAAAAATTTAQQSPTTQQQQPFVSASNNAEQALRLDVFRAPDPSLVHVYHPIECDRGLDEAQYKMCVGTKANTLGSYAYVEELLLANRAVVEHFRELNGS